MPSNEPALGQWGWQLANSQAHVDWLWTGFLAAGNVTLLSSQWKSGKTTLLSVLLARMQSGGALADRAVKPGRAVVISEETAAQWQLRRQHMNLDHVFFITQPFRTKPDSAPMVDPDRAGSQAARPGAVRLGSD